MNYLFRHANNYRVYGILKKIFSQKSFSKTLRNPRKNLRKESWQRFKWYNQMSQMAQVGTSGTNGTGRSGELRGTSGTRTRGSSDSVEQVEQGQGVCPVEPLHLTQCGTTSRENFRCVCYFVLLLLTDIGESLRSRGQFLTTVDLGWPDPHPSP